MGVRESADAATMATRKNVPKSKLNSRIEKTPAKQPLSGPPQIPGDHKMTERTQQPAAQPPAPSQPAQPTAPVSTVPGEMNTSTITNFFEGTKFNLHVPVPKPSEGPAAPLAGIFDSAFLDPSSCSSDSARECRKSQQCREVQRKNGIQTFHWCHSPFLARAGLHSSHASQNCNRRGEISGSERQQLREGVEEDGEGSEKGVH
jgi:hypothetical protein